MKVTYDVLSHTAATATKAGLCQTCNKVWPLCRTNLCSAKLPRQLSIFHQQTIAKQTWFLHRVS